MLDWLRRHWRKPGSPPPLPDALWTATLDRHPFLRMLDEPQQAGLRELCRHFLDQKEFHGAQGLVVTDEMALAIAAQACLPLLRLAPPDRPASVLRWYDDFVGIVIHPGAVRARRQLVDDDGVVHEYDEDLSGEALDGGPVMLSWEDVAGAGESAVEGYNVVIHEFAHKIDLRDGAADGCPPLPPGFMGHARSRDARALWLATFDEAWQRFGRQVDASDRFAGMVEPPWLDPYAGESISEFFAVVVEAYFVNPARLALEFPTLMPLLDAFFAPGGPESQRGLRP